MKKQLMIGLGLVMAAGGLAGCASKTTATEKKPAAAQAAAPAKPEQKEEYVSQTSLGSWIPKKVKKSEAKTSDQDTADSQAAIKDLTERGNPRRSTGN